MRQVIDKVAFIYFEDKKILMARTRGKDRYYVPGGKREKGEDDMSVLVREIQEELNVTIQPHTVQFYGVFEAQAHGQPEGVFVRMRCYTGEYKGVVSPASEIDDILFYSYDQKDSVGPVDQMIFDDAFSQGLLE
jgi:8-oxo-dGTP pyrophosphatase MutT (NUDIX family)